MNLEDIKEVRECLTQDDANGLLSLGNWRLINITFQNKGNFNLDGSYISYSNSSEGAPKYKLNISGQNNDISSSGFLYFGISIPTSLRSGESFQQEFDYSDYGLIEKVQLIPFINDVKEGLLICEKRVLIQNINNCE